MISPSEFRPTVDLFAAPLEGMRRGVSRANAAAGRLAEGDLAPENIVDVVQAETVVKASAAYFRTVENILGTLLNTRA